MKHQMEISCRKL